MKLRRNIQAFLVLASMCLAPSLLAQEFNAERSFYRGNDAFEAGDYKAAIAAYKEILDKGKAGASLHFNLANAHLFAQEIGPALYHFRLAENMQPRNEDIRRNIAATRSRAVEKIEWEKPAKFVQVLLFLHTKTTAKECFQLFMLVYLIGLMALAVARWRNLRLPRRLGYLFLLVAILLFLSLMSRHSEWGIENRAVVLPTEIQVFTGPSATAYPVHFVLHSGAELLVLEEQETWAKVEVPSSGQRGYARLGQLGLYRR